MAAHANAMKAPGGRRLSGNYTLAMFEPTYGVKLCQQGVRAERANMERRGQPLFHNEPTPTEVTTL
jgi:hypothetical protein